MTTIDHHARIVRRQRGPLGFVHAFICSCGCASPEAIDRYTAIIAKRSHLIEVGLQQTRLVDAGLSE